MDIYFFLLNFFFFKLRFLTFRNVSHLAQAQAAPLMNGRGGSGRFGGGDQCPRCGKQVYFAEEVRALGKKYHKLCLRCGMKNLCIYAW